MAFPPISNELFDRKYLISVPVVCHAHFVFEWLDDKQCFETFCLCRFLNFGRLARAQFMSDKRKYSALVVRFQLIMLEFALC